MQLLRFCCYNNNSFITVFTFYDGFTVRCSSDVKGGTDLELSMEA